jgi:hypothetical protein
MTAVANSAFTAAQFNTHVRDNLLETGPAKATAAGRLLVTTGANALAERVVTQATVDTSQSTSSTSFTDLATVGPSVTVTTGAAALVWFAAQMLNSAVSAVTQCAVSINGAAPDARADLYIDGQPAGSALRCSTVHLFTGLTPGSNTFKLQYKVGSGTGTWYDRCLGVLAL